MKEGNSMYNLTRIGLDMGALDFDRPLPKTAVRGKRR
jgi:hypothetical protein